MFYCDDIFLNIISPDLIQNDEALMSPREAIYDFVYTSK